MFGRRFADCGRTAGNNSIESARLALASFSHAKWFLRTVF
jgi:hypothetical protein